MPTEKPTPAPDGRVVGGRRRSRFGRSSSSIHVFDDFPSVTYLFDIITSLLPGESLTTGPIRA